LLRSLIRPCNPHILKGESYLCAIASGACAVLVSIAILEAGMPKKPVISVVDDDPSVREGTVDLLNSMGFIARPFQRADDFLKSSCRPGTSCLIADVRMPGMSGLELHNR